MVTRLVNMTVTRKGSTPDEAVASALEALSSFGFRTPPATVVEVSEAGIVYSTLHAETWFEATADGTKVVET